MCLASRITHSFASIGCVSFKARVVIVVAISELPSLLPFQSVTNFYTASRRVEVRKPTSDEQHFTLLLHSPHVLLLVLFVDDVDRLFDLT